MAITKEEFDRVRGNGTPATATATAEPAVVPATVEEPADAARTCPQCGGAVSGPAQRIYCSARCRTKAEHERSRSRVKAEAVPTVHAPAPTPQPDPVFALVTQLLHVAGEVEVALEDGRRVIARAR